MNMIKKTLNNDIKVDVPDFYKYLEENPIPNLQEMLYQRLKKDIDNFLILNPDYYLFNIEIGYCGDDFTKNVYTIAPVFKTKNFV